MTSWPQRVAVIGAAGTVGSSVCAQLASRGVGQEIYMQDVKDNLVEAHRIDITDGQTVLGVDSPKLITGEAPAGTVNAVVVAASLPEDPEGDRREFLEANAGLLDSLAPAIQKQLSPAGIVVLLTNPVDILAHWMSRTQSLPRERLIGYALNDTARFRYAVAQEFDVAPSHVDAMVLGEHGAGQVPIFSSVRIDGEAVTWTDHARRRLEHHMEGWFSRYLALKAGRTSGWASGLGVAKLLEDLGRGRSLVTTVSSHDVEGLPDTFMSLPVAWHGTGFHAHLPPLAANEMESLVAIAQNIRGQAQALNI
ncbi:malate dehydrogenase [Nesterenkonia haasae]|uniref:malate dehydrogenase n=1 Tax=Nesterenkonia haasae TaxID=2587813 RepID=UPI0013920C31|nr:hypothetical protein [Nesterenkonia haasae]